jgi:hypothetical protein
MGIFASRICWTGAQDADAVNTDKDARKSSAMGIFRAARAAM